MPHEMILVEIKGRVGIITMNRPERLNAVHPTMSAEIRQQVEAWNSDPAIGAIIITGAGRGFCAGADFGVWQRDIKQRETGGQNERAERLAQEAQQEPWPLFWRRSKPVVCAINGPSVGAGLTVFLACDVRIASEQARLSMRFVRAGVMAEVASTHILPHMVGLGHALELMLSARIISGEEAARIGLVNRVVPHDKLMEEALATAQEIAFNPTESLLAVKRLIWQNLDERDIKLIQEREGVELEAAMARPAFQEAVSAFSEKRQPDFHKQ